MTRLRRLAPLLGSLLAAAACGSEPEHEPAPAPRFATRLEVPAHGRPLGLLAADLDGDGRPEVALTTLSPGALQLWRFGAAGEVEVLARVPVGDSPVGPVALHGEGAGRALVAVASRAERRLLAFDLAGPEPAAAVFSITLAEAPRALAARGPELAVVGERTLLLLEDGRPAGTLPLGAERATCALFLEEGGLAIGFQASEELHVFAEADLAHARALAGSDAHERGSRRPARVFRLEGIPRALAQADLDGDGDLELALAGGDGSLWIFGAGLTGGAAAWIASPAEPRRLETPRPVPIALAVLGRAAPAGAELVSLSYYGLTYSVLASSGARLAGPDFAGGTPVASALADLDGDGAPELLVANRDAARVSVVPGRGAPAEDPFVHPEKVWTGGNPLSLAAADLDGDGDLDAAVLGASSGRLTVLRNEGGTLEQVYEVEVGPSPRALVAADLDGDGHADLALLVQQAAHARLVVLRSDGRGGLEPPIASELGKSGADLVAADLGGGGRPDLFAADPDGGAVHWIGNASTPGQLVLRSARTIPVAPRPVALAALELAGRTELVFAGGAGEGAAVASLAPESGEVRVLAPIPGQPVSLAAADFDGDGRADLAIAAQRAPDSQAGEVHVLLASEGGLTAVFRGPAGPNPRRLAAADANGDGRAELWLASRGGHHVNHWVAASEPPLLRRRWDLGADLGPMDLVAADFDGDGALDLLVANAFSEALSLIRGLPPP